MDIQNLRRETKKIVTYALCAKQYQQRVPCNVLVDMKVIRSVLKAAYALRKTTGAGVIATGEETPPAWQYCRSGGRLSHWDDFPRSLSLKEYCSPFRVFKKLFRRCHLRQYVQDWETLVEAALSPYEMDLQLNPVRICTCITKLLEAAHLIWIREGGGGLSRTA